MWMATVGMVMALSGAVAGASDDDDGVKVGLAPGKGVTIKGHGFSVQARARVQVRYTTADQLQAPGFSTPTSDFAIRRARLQLRMEAFEAWEMVVQLGFSNQDIEPDLRIPLRDAYIIWKQFREFRVRAGQMKVPYGRQRVVSSSALQMVDRAESTGEFNLDRDIGVIAFSDDMLGLGKRIGWQLGVFGGDGRNRFDNPDGVMLVGRLQLAPFGDIGELSEPDFGRSSKPRAALGLAAAYNRNTNRARSTFGTVYTAGRTDYAHGGLDLLLKWHGFSFTSEAMIRVADRDAMVKTEDGETVRDRTRSGLGFFAQAAALITEHVEISARYGEIRPLPAWNQRDTRFAVHELHEAGMGGSVYLAEHALKLQVDAFNLWSERLNESTQRIRAQVQFYF